STHADRPGEALFYRREARLLREEERDACRRHDAVLVTSRRDQQLFEALVPGLRTFVIPNGVDTSYFAPSLEPSEPDALVFTGMMAYRPNYDGILHFLDEIFPLIRAEVPTARVYVVGSRPPAKLAARASDSVVVTGHVE